MSDGFWGKMAGRMLARALNTEAKLAEARNVLELPCCDNPRPGSSGATIYCASCTADLATIVPNVGGTITVRRAPPGMYYGRDRRALKVKR